MCPRCKSYITPEEKTPLANGGESGVVLITVVVLIMVMSILAIGVMGTNVSQSLSNQHQIDRIKAEQLAKGAFWDSYMKILRGIDPVANPTPSETLDNKDFTVDVDVVAGPPDEYLLSVDWPE